MPLSFIFGLRDYGDHEPRVLLRGLREKSGLLAYVMLFLAITSCYSWTRRIPGLTPNGARQVVYSGHATQPLVLKNAVVSSAVHASRPEPPIVHPVQISARYNHTCALEQYG